MAEAIAQKRAQLRAAGVLRSEVETAQRQELRQQRLAAHKAAEQQRLQQAVHNARADRGLDRQRSRHWKPIHTDQKLAPWLRPTGERENIHAEHVAALDGYRAAVAADIPPTVRQFEAHVRHERKIKPWQPLGLHPETLTRISKRRAGWAAAQRRATRRAHQQQQLPAIPDGKIKTYGALINAARAKKNHASSALRLWFLARHLDTNGQGVVTLATIKEQGKSFCNIGNKQIANLIARGAELGFWQRGNHRNGGKVLRLASLQNVAVALGVGRVSRGVWAEIADLRSLKRWHAVGLAGWHTGKGGKRGNPIAAACVARETGIPERSQRRYCQQNKDLLQRLPNVAAVDRTADNFQMLRELDANGGKYFVAKGQLFERLPNTYQTSMPRSRPGSIRKINALLNADLSDNMGTGNDQHLVRRFHATMRQAEQGAKYEVKRRVKSEASIDGDGLHYGRVPARKDHSIALRGFHSWGAVATS